MTVQLSGAAHAARTTPTHVPSVRQHAPTSESQGVGEQTALGSHRAVAPHETMLTVEHVPSSRQQALRMLRQGKIEHVTEGSHVPCAAAQAAKVLVVHTPVARQHARVMVTHGAAVQAVERSQSAGWAQFSSIEVEHVPSTRQHAPVLGHGAAEQARAGSQRPNPPLHAGPLMIVHVPLF